MGMTITLRDTQTPCYFKEYLFKFLDAFPNIDEILLCSGYFQELKPYIDDDGKEKTDSFRATLEIDPNRNNMVKRFPALKRITTVGIKDDLDSHWGVSYQNFVESLRTCMGKDKVKAYYDTSKNWHAKEMILLCNGRAVAGIVGSSNITKRAYGSYPKFNIEADTFIYDPSADDQMQELAMAIRKENNDAFIIVGNNNQTANDGSETMVLDKQYEKIMKILQDKNFFTAI